ncbi:MAG: sigma-54-dependent Fis family transcriptional regulator [Elusimicrobia bacterium]|nr:sigma-54-dependent Fis family transcriptional regulator [Elusimicrobiota bacterium]
MPKLSLPAPSAKFRVPAGAPVAAGASGPISVPEALRSGGISVLVIEDDPIACKHMAVHLKDHKITFAHDFPTAKQKIKQGAYNICFIDLQLGENDDGCSGLKLIPLAVSKKIYSVVMSGHDAGPIVERAHELGCDDFYAKGDEANSIEQILDKFCRRRNPSKEKRLFTQRFITKDPDTQSYILEALKYAPSELPFLILGPSGAGKTSLAHLVHAFSRRSGPFVSINCAAYTQDLLEAELFGFKKGAFTGADEERKGKLLIADKGTLFLDGIGAMSLKMQTKLLKAIEEKTFYPVGSDKPETSCFRIISATQEDMSGLIKENRLHFEFFQRIHGFTIKLKPLSQRTSDIFPLIDFLARAGTKKRLFFEPEAKEELLGYPWPGNVRELKKFVDLLTAGQEGRVSAQRVRRLLNTLRLEEGGNRFANEEHYRFAKQHGLAKVLERFMDAIILHSLENNAKKRTHVIKELKISNWLFYQSIKRSGIANIRQRNVKNDPIGSPVGGQGPWPQLLPRSSLRAAGPTCLRHSEGHVPPDQGASGSLGSAPRAAERDSLVSKQDNLLNTKNNLDHKTNEILVPA